MKKSFETGYRHGLQVAAQIMLEVHATVSDSGWESEMDRLQAFQALLAIAAKKGSLVHADRFRAVRRDDGGIDVTERPAEPMEFLSANDLIEQEMAAAGASRRTSESTTVTKPLPPATWEELVELEPKLLDLLHLAQSVRDMGGKYHCSMSIFEFALKPALAQLVGEERRRGDSRLKCYFAGALCSRKILEALPPCRNCNCP